MNNTQPKVRLASVATVGTGSMGVCILKLTPTAMARSKITDRWRSRLKAAVILNKENYQ